jgi:2-polyprenyl-6-methoxyphenol hydroxylase-like FAD-dependent oxidoreductase
LTNRPAPVHPQLIQQTLKKGMVEMEHTGAVIVGGGPAGMIAGLLLSRAGVEVTVLEKHADFLRDFRGDTVHPSTMQLLDELGLAEKFAKLPQSRVDQVVLPGDEKGPLVLADLSLLRKSAYPYIAMVPQWDLLDMLAEVGAGEPTFTLRMSTEFTGLRRTGGKVTGITYRTSDGATGELSADLVIGADGRWSPTREQAGLKAHEFPVPFDAWWLRINTPEGAPPALTPMMRDGQFAVNIPRKDYIQLAYLAAKGIDDRLRAEGIEAFRARLRKLMPGFEAEIDELRSMDEIKHLDVRLSRLHTWHIDGLLCIGDAAHAMSPMGGVGINLAVQDAVAAATLLAAPLRRGRVTVDELAKVRTRRWLPTAAVQLLQRVLHRQIIAPVMDGRRETPPPGMLAAIRRFPKLAYLPARLIGVGLRPEHAPAFARRDPEAVR